MKLFRFFRVIIFISVLGCGNALGQVKIDNSNIINKLFSLSKYNAAEINAYYLSQNFKQASVNKATMGRFIMQLQKYTSAKTSDSYFLNVLDGKTFAVGYSTFKKSYIPMRYRLLRTWVIYPLQLNIPGPGKPCMANPAVKTSLYSWFNN